MNQPEGYDDGSGRVCKLKKSLYGLKQAPRVWNKTFTCFLLKQGFTQSEADPCLFIYNKNGRNILIALYVDDGLVAAKQGDSELNNFLQHLQKEFHITYSPAEYFLSLEIEHLDDGSFAINQEHYIDRILEKFKMADCNGISTPVESSCEQSEDESDFLTKEPYREAVGSLNYLAVCTRPDIAYAVSLVSQVLDKPTKKHWKMVKRIFRYLKETKDMKLMYSSKPLDSLTGYSDADFAGDKGTRKSHTGVVCLHNGTAISWISQRQKCVSLSTTEAEFVAASESAKELIWLNNLLREITNEKEIPLLHVDNMSAIQLVKNPVFRKRSKHIDVKYYFVRDMFESEKLRVEHVATNEQLADSFTKPQSKQKLKAFCKNIGLLKNAN